MSGRGGGGEACFLSDAVFTGIVLVQAFTQLDEEDHGHHGAEATHALAEVITTIGHVGYHFYYWTCSYPFFHFKTYGIPQTTFVLQVGFEMLFWGLAGFVDPVDHVDKKEGLGADALAELAGVDEHDEFFKDNAIEVIKDHQ